MRVIPHIKWNESHASMLSWFKLCLTPFKSVWMTPYKYWEHCKVICLCLHLVWSPLLVTLLSQTLIASWWQKIVFSQLSKKINCESPSWSCGWELMEQPNSFLKISSHLYFHLQGFTKIYRKGSQTCPCLCISCSPQTLREAQTSLPGSKQATKSPLAHPQVFLSIITPTPRA